MKSFTTWLRNLITAIIAPLTDRTHHQPVNYANIMALLQHLCDFDEEKCLWVMRWLAYPLRNPGAKMSRALVVTGPEGTGKTLFFERIVTQLYEYGSSVVRARPIDSGHNWPSSTRLVVLEGQFSPSAANHLKALVIEQIIRYTETDGHAVQRRNRANFVFLATGCTAPVEQPNRRFCIVRTPAPMSPAFYSSIDYEIENGGIDAFRDFLMRDLDMGDFDTLTPPPGALAPAAPQVA